MRPMIRIYSFRARTEEVRAAKAAANEATSGQFRDVQHAARSVAMDLLREGLTPADIHTKLVGNTAALITYRGHNLLRIAPIA